MWGGSGLRCWQEPGEQSRVQTRPPVPAKSLSAGCPLPPSSPLARCGNLGALCHPVTPGKGGVRGGHVLLLQSGCSLLALSSLGQEPCSSTFPLRHGYLFFHFKETRNTASFPDSQAEPAVLLHPGCDRAAKHHGCYGESGLGSSGCCRRLPATDSVFGGRAGGVTGIHIH